MRRYLLLLVVVPIKACTLDASHEPPPETVEEAIQTIMNGEALPWIDYRGAVRIQYWTGRDWAEFCSGQIVSRRGILTAAHCFTARDITRPGQELLIKVFNQTPTGHWNVYSYHGANPWMTAYSYPHPDYVDLPLAGDDVGVLRTQYDLSNVDSSHAAALYNEPDRPLHAGWAYGYGLSAPDGTSKTLRTGRFEDLSWGTSIGASTGAGAAALCKGDSGGPLKLVFVSGQADGLVFGVNRSGSGSTTLCGDYSSSFASVAHKTNWIEQQLGASCVDETFTQGYLQARKCW